MINIEEDTKLEDLIKAILDGQKKNLEEWFTSLGITNENAKNYSLGMESLPMGIIVRLYNNYGMIVGSFEFEYTIKEK